jgi:hypothetical protein
MDRDEMNNIYRGPSIYASDQVSVHLAKRFREDFWNSTNQKQELPVTGMFFFITNWAEISNLYKGPSIDASY